MNIKVLDSIDPSLILQEYQKIEDKLEWLESDQTKQCGLQHLEEFPSLTDSCGRIKTEQSKFGLRYKNKESDFKICHKIIKNTIFEELIDKFKLFRSRLMWVKPKSCYSLHVDFGPRIHIPIVTNSSAMFVFKDSGVVHLSLGKIYWVDTRKIHSFANFGDTDRLHLIGCV